MVADDLARIAGLPAELGIDEELARGEQRLRVRIEERRYKKPMTLVEGFDRDFPDLKGMAKRLKQRLATGGGLKDGVIELQGDHIRKVKALLEDEGFFVDT